MNIGMLLNGNYPKDIRVRKEAETLAKSHKVFVLCKQSVNEKAYEIVNNVHVIRKITYRDIKHEGIIDILTSINFIHPYFSKALPNFITNNKIEALHVHDLPLAKTAYKFGKKHQLKLVLDLHENYPEALKIWFSWRKNPVIRLKNNLFFNYTRWKKHEASIIKKYDVIIAVVDEMKTRLIEQHQLEASKIKIVPNSEKKEFVNNFDTTQNTYFDTYKDRFIISYVGGFGPHRGLHTAIEAMVEVSKKIPNALLVLVGPSNNDVKSFLQKIVADNSLENHVIIKGSEPFKNVVKIMTGSHVNIIPHVSNEHTESAIPHKFYQILLSGKPLLVSNCAPMKRIVNTYDIATVFKAENPTSFSKSIIDIHSDYDLALQKATKGNDLALNGTLNWETTSEELVAIYNNL